jgi:threonine synthase
VSDAEILAAIPAVASRSGVFLEPAAAAGWAGLLRAREMGVIDSRDRVVMLGTGNGLKDIPAALRAMEEAGVEPTRVASSVDAVEQAVGELVSS